jgi:arylsulfatase A-like enzyme
MDDSPIPEDIYHTSYITEKTISFLKRFSKGEYGDKSFFVHCSYPDPHLPVCPPGRYKEMYDPDSLDIPTNLEDVEKLYHHKVLGPFIDVYRPNWLRDTTENELRQFLAYTYGTISMIDSSVGQILAALESFGLEEDTIVIFTSDHGDLMGDHGLLLKGPAHYNGVLNVPLIWKVPGLTKEGEISDSLVSSVDIPTTLMELLNIREKYRPIGMQGNDITPILGEPKNSIRDCCIIEEDEQSQKDSHNLPSLRVRTMITDTYRMTLYQNHEDFGELYNRKKDPKEQNNLWNNETYKPIKQRLIKKFLHELIKLQPDYPHKQARA